MRRNVLKRAGDVVAPLWSSGLALTIVMALLIVLSSRRAQARLPIYALLGTVFPLAVAGSDRADWMGPVAPGGTGGIGVVLPVGLGIPGRAVPPTPPLSVSVCSSGP